MSPLLILVLFSRLVNRLLVAEAVTFPCNNAYSIYSIFVQLLFFGSAFVLPSPSPVASLSLSVGIPGIKSLIGGVTHVHDFVLYCWCKPNTNPRVFPTNLTQCHCITRLPLEYSLPLSAWGQEEG